MPDKLSELIEDYGQYVQTNGVIELPLDYQWAEEMTVNTFKRNYLPVLLRAVSVIALTVFVVIYLRRRWKKTQN